MDRHNRNELLEEYDIVCVGFGKKGLALATSLADQGSKANILILEKGSSFSEELNFASAERQGGSPFLHDLITQQNPRSKYTYINFLHQTKLLLGFTNASQMAPSRALTSRYMAWVAEQINELGWVGYDQEVLRVQPVMMQARGKVSKWLIDLKSNKASVISRICTKRLVIATGSMKHLPEPLLQAKLQPFVLPLHDTQRLMERMYQKRQPINIAIIGSDQEAAELFELLHTIPGQHRATMFFGGTALRADDSTPFSRATIDGSWSNLNYLPPEIRQKLVATTVSAEYPTIDLPTLERLYVSHYAERVRNLDHSTHRFRMCPSQEIVKAQLENDQISFLTRNTVTGQEAPAYGTFDVVMATLERGQFAAEALLGPVSSLLDGAGLTVDSEYAVNFRHSKISPSCGVWVMGSLLDRNARRDDFSMLAASASRTVQSVLKCMRQNTADDAMVQEMAVL